MSCLARYLDADEMQVKFISFFSAAGLFPFAYFIMPEKHDVYPDFIR